MEPSWKNERTSKTRRAVVYETCRYYLHLYDLYVYLHNAFPPAPCSNSQFLATVSHSQFITGHLSRFAVIIFCWPRIQLTA